MAASATDGNEEADATRSAVAFGHVNGIFVRKVPLTMIIYPDIAEQVKQVVQLLNYVYEVGLRRGITIDQPGVVDDSEPVEPPQPAVQDPTMSTTDLQD